MLRKRKNVTQEKLGEIIGVDGNTISRYERDIIKPSIESMQRLADFFGVAIDDLLNGPQLKEIEIRLVMSLDPMKGGVTQMDIMNGNAFTLCVEREHLGIIGSGKFEDENDIDSFLSRAKAQLMLGLKVQKEQRELKG